MGTQTTTAYNGLCLRIIRGRVRVQTFVYIFMCARDTFRRCYYYWTRNLSEFYETTAINNKRSFRIDNRRRLRRYYYYETSLEVHRLVFRFKDFTSYLPHPCATFVSNCSADCDGRVSVRFHSVSSTLNSSISQESSESGFFRNAVR